MTTQLDPRTFEHPYVSISQLCFFFQKTRSALLLHLERRRLEPAHTPDGAPFTTRPASVFYPASEILFALEPTAQAIFVGWQKGDYDLPPINPQAPPPLSAVRNAPVGPRGGRPF